MKKTLAIILCIVMLATVAMASVAADEYKAIDARELQQWGQVHHYLPAVSVTDIPVIDGVIGEDEYYYSFDFLLDGSNQAAYLNESSATNGFTNTEWCKCYMSFDGTTFYMAMAAKDTYYVIDKDMWMINLGFTDGGNSRNAVERLRFDFEQDATTGEFKPGISEFFKYPDGNWEPSRGLTFDDFVTEAEFVWDDDEQIMLFEAAWDVQRLMDEFKNELDIEDARMYFNPLIRMQGGSAPGADDGPLEQGYVWHYMGVVPTEVKMNFTLDYPEETYYAGMFPNIVHFCEEPEPTTPAPTEATTTAATTTKAATTAKATTAKATTAAGTIIVAGTDAPVATTAAPATTAAEKGCGGTIALSALALVPMLGAAVVFGKKKED